MKKIIKFCLLLMLMSISGFSQVCYLMQIIQNNDNLTLLHSSQVKKINFATLKLEYLKNKTAKDSVKLFEYKKLLDLSQDSKNKTELLWQNAEGRVKLADSIKIKTQADLDKTGKKLNRANTKTGIMGGLFLISTTLLLIKTF